MHKMPKVNACSLEWCAFALLCLLPGLARANAEKAPENAVDPSVSIRTNYYTFGGTNHTQLRAAMLAARPWKQGFNFDARTKWDLHSTYRFHREDGQFSIAVADVRTDVVITLPFWIPGHPVSRDLVMRWQKCLAGLCVHEQGHLVLAKAATAEVKKRLLALHGFGTLQELSAAADQTLRDTLDEFRERERKYDQVTRHGYTQGAVFPMTTLEAADEPAARPVPGDRPVNPRGN